ncbi:MAG TPA: DEAD/DEAH box helicase, partial [Myxococcota bacterium]|nr:DEAD/DEAH box helicase [Myxococcota bacterium]
MTFDQLGLAPQLMQALRRVNYKHPTPIQAAAIPPALKGRDVLGVAQTGTGKTASFVLPILNRLLARPGRGIRAVILAPTRELAEQIHTNLTDYAQFTSLRAGMIMGGVSVRPQENMLRRGVDVLVATPGRLLDHLRRGTARLDNVEVLVLDEADRMLDMGFVHDMRALLKYVPARRQTMLFSATLPDTIQRLAREFLHDAEHVEVATRSSTPRSVQQVVHPVASENKRQALLHLLGSEDLTQVIVFTRTKRGASKLTEHLVAHGERAVVIHGNK